MNYAKPLRSTPSRPRTAASVARREQPRAGINPAEQTSTTDRSVGEKVLFVTSEMRDFVKAGGLGDVSAALPRVLAHEHDVRVLIPGYRAVLQSGRPLRKVGATRRRGELPPCEIYELQTDDGLRVLAVCNQELFDREGSPYVNAKGLGWADNDIRFATFSSVAADIAAGQAGLAWQPELLHLNDWTCALAACYTRWRHQSTPTVLTIHNLAYQGVFPATTTRRIGAPEHATELDFHGQVSYLRGGIVRSDCLITVSESYAQQIVDPVYGCGMDRLLARRRNEGRLVGILNGIDDSWHPQHDEALDTTFSVGEWEQRQCNTSALREEFGLEPIHGPLFIFVSRMVHQKGLDLVYEAAPQIIAAGGQLILIGRGEPMFERMASMLAKRFPGRIAAHIGFKEDVAHRMFAGADFLLMPSRYEPCGLSQMYAQAYGCLPIAHATGGLNDTIEDGVSGLLFQSARVSDLRGCLQRAFRIYAEPLLLEAMRGAAMLERHDWSRSGQQYTRLYRQLCTQKAVA
ncbi:glycogen synthase GlgA [Dyella acidiphila]|uniref:Glycogen synthase n=1 Tax=Dyella acidiphila TaxID=2775866 RepID=A0ABR9GCQ3_9GAMM|nr:glycogen synthase GlgA [Dyella acidiphila]MBE1161810.1 glycogen synthase GlgA [Dyella acidiphila]